MAVSGARTILGRDFRLAERNAKSQKKIRRLLGFARIVAASPRRLFRNSILRDVIVAQEEAGEETGRSVLAPGCHSGSVCGAGADRFTAGTGFEPIAGGRQDLAPVQQFR